MNFLHRDIKTDNFCIGFGKKAATIYIIDFGLSKRYRCPKTDDHIALKKNKGFLGTNRFASVTASQGFEQSRRDDLEAVGHILIYFLTGSLPWIHIEN